MERQGVNVRGNQLRTRNVAAVTVTAKLPGFSRTGGKIDVNVSAIGDATSLRGGTLVATPLQAADGNVYAIAQGQIVTEGFRDNNNNDGIPTSAIVPDGAIIEKESGFALNGMSDLKLALKNPDVTTAKQIADAINSNVGLNTAVLKDPGTVILQVPFDYEDNVTELLAQIENLEVETDTPARIVIDEKTGTIVFGEDVKIDTVAVSQGNLVVEIKNNVDTTGFIFEDEFAADFLPQQNPQEAPETGNIATLNKSANLADLINALNSLGVTTRDLITILQSIKTAGALQADIVTR